MKLTALEIRKHEFARGFRGYDPEEVDAFLQMLSQQWQELSDEIKSLEGKLEERTTQLDQFRREEHALRELLQTAREGAQRRLQEAQEEADSLLEEAKERATTRIDDAERRAIEIVRSAEEERHQARRDASRIAISRGEIIARLRAFLGSEMEVLARYEGDEADRASEEEQRFNGPALAAVTPEVLLTSEDPEAEEVPEPEPAEAAIPEAEESEPLAEADDSPDEAQAKIDDSGKNGSEVPEVEQAPDEAEPAEATLFESVEPEAESAEDVKPRARRKNQPARQGDLMDHPDGDDKTGATEEIRKIRRILEDLDH